MAQLLAELQDFDLSQFTDIDRVGAWPAAVRVTLWIICCACVLVPGYVLHVADLQRELGRVRAEESRLRGDYEDRFVRAAPLQGYLRQQREIEASFETVLGRLPSDTEIPGLIEDITLVGLNNGLTFTSIELQPETKHEFYIEKPIAILVSGGYHALGAFVSDVAELSRIVTLHDFAIAPADRGELSLRILAKTYRYNDERD